MADRFRQKRIARQRRRYRTRKLVVGTPERLRLVVNRSLCNIEAQIVDDQRGHSLVGLSTLSKEFEGRESPNRVEQGRALGKQVAARAREQGIDRVVFDRAGRAYHGIVKAVAEGAREGGLSF